MRTCVRQQIAQLASSFGTCEGLIYNSFSFYYSGAHTSWCGVPWCVYMFICLLVSVLMEILRTVADGVVYIFSFAYNLHTAQLGTGKRKSCAMRNINDN